MTVRFHLRAAVAAVAVVAITACGSTPDHDEPDAGSSTPDALSIPPRQQWENAGGYCGETSIQSIGLYYGAWISEQVVRSVAGGELLLGVNDVKALGALHFSYSVWNNETAQPQFMRFMQWLKQKLANRVPCIFAAYVTDGNDDPDYDHIMPAVGIRYSDLNAYDANDVLVFNNNFGGQLERQAGALEGTRANCTHDTLAGGCIPHDVDYGVAVTGLVDMKHVTLPVSIAVAGSSEPNVSIGEAATSMNAVVTASGLTAGASYALLRYDDRAKVPTDATAAELLASPYSFRYDFTADAAQWTFTDPAPFSSDGAVYYRCVPRT